MGSAAASYRAGVDQLLVLASQLTAQQQDRIRTAVNARHDPEKAWDFIRGTDAENLGGRFLKAREEADADLSPAEVLELEGRIDNGLARWP